MYHHQHSHTDENVPPLNQNSTIASNGRSAPVAPLPHQKLQGNMDTLIHQIEKEAYSHVLLAFKCQSDVLTWEKADLMVELRKELRVSDDEHTQLLTQVNTNSTIHQIREWRKTSCYKPAQHVHDDSLHSTISSSPKKHNSSSQPHRAAAPSAGGRIIINGSSYSVVPPKKPIREEAIAGKARNEIHEAGIAINKAPMGKNGLYYDSGEANEMEEWVNLNKMRAEDTEWENEEGRPILRIVRR
ncbi:protein EMSY-LIKE 3-like isoform X3 [Arachis duranensis]|uniref:Protein EMSY-LIKE 3-like isoform X3 n=1 Tax=Arachis duranensis TaxID=130453 RepID=A0A6P4DJL8_ARADU|nr:protein EMSY-LIKE 3-like isoform X3 [Arachis duranensis]